MNPTKDWSRIVIRTMGGALDMFIFYGPTYLDVVRQYQEIVGRPQMMPLWAHGLFAKSPAYSNSSLALEAIK